jgi:threonine aldolase
MIMHCDGARLWNASIETGIPLSEYCKEFDSVNLCLSKGVGAPIGSILVGKFPTPVTTMHLSCAHTHGMPGPRDFIQKARHYRKLFGGGWRQSGPLAEAALYSLSNIFHTGAMKQDHQSCRRVAQELESMGKTMILLFQMTPL